jgi:glutathione S-transferase
MRLHSSYTSPYVRKVKILAHEVGLWDGIEEVYTNPADEAVLRPLNPLGKIPALELEGVGSLFDSRVICEALDGLHRGVRRIPVETTARLKVLRVQALADGLADAANLRRNEALRPDPQIHQPFLDRQDLAIKHGLLALDRLADDWEPDTPPLLDQIATAAALGYIRFRYETLRWRAHCPALARWEEWFFARPSLRETEPVNPPGCPAPSPQTIPPKWPSD